MLTTERNTRAQRQDADPPLPASPPINLVTIHGTFAKNATWIGADSSFCRWLQDVYPGPIAIHPFRWSGRNSHEARLRAAAELAAFIDRLPQPRYIVGHSHGGTVALYALRITSAGGVASLGTPFFDVRARSLADLEPFVRDLLPRMALYGGTGLVLQCMQGEQAFVAGLMVVGLAVWFKLVVVPLALIPAARRIATRQRALVDRLCIPATTVPLLTFFTRRDEAGWWLRRMDQIANLPFVVMSPYAVSLIALVLVFGSLAFSLAHAAPAPPWSYASPLATIIGFALQALLAAMVGLPALLLGFVGVYVVAIVMATAAFQAWMIGWSWLFRGHALGYGENLLDNWLARIAPVVLPRNASRLSRRGVVAKGWLHHSSFYGRRRVALLVARWIHRCELERSPRGRILSHGPSSRP